MPTKTVAEVKDWITSIKQDAYRAGLLRAAQVCRETETQFGPGSITRMAAIECEAETDKPWVGGPYKRGQILKEAADVANFAMMIADCSDELNIEAALKGETT